MMSILIVGGTGHIGSNVVKYLQYKQLDVTFTSRKIEKENGIYLDLCKVEDFDFSLISDVEYIVFTAANLSAEDCAKNESEVRKTNVTGTVRFIREALKRNKKIIYLSSDIVYGSDEQKVYDETSVPAPAFAYGKMKLEVEKCFENCSNFKSLRLSYVFSMEDKFVQYCKRCEKNGEIVEVYHPYYRKFISLFELCECIYQIIERWQEFKFPVLNVCGHEMISKIRIMDEINRVYQKKICYQVVRPNEDYYKNRPAFLNITSLYLYQNGILGQKDFGQTMEEEKVLRETDIWC